jgi:two-component system, cell cycle response regulator
MSAATVCLLGFSRFERATFESFFRLSAKRTPAYAALDDPRAANFLIVDADDAEAVARAARVNVPGCTLTLGKQPQPGMGAHLPRPINLMLIMRALDALRRPAAASPPAAVAAPPAVPRLQEPSRANAAQAAERLIVPPQVSSPLAMAPPVATDALPAKALSHSHPTFARAVAVAPSLVKAEAAAPSQEQAADGPRLDHILVVDDSDIALRFMALHLQRFGFQIHLVRSGQEALDRVAQRHFEFVFLDVMMEGMDGYQTCKAIKRQTPPDGRKPPTVVMVTSRGTALDKLRGTMAGCDAYLTKPLEENALLKIIGDREIQNVGYTDTAIANTLF